MNIITVDPGKMTGLATWINDEWSPFALPYFEAMDWIEPWIASGTIDEVVSESIHIGANTHKKGPQVLQSVEQIGVMRHLCRHAGVTFITQTPAEAKGFGTDSKLRALGWWTKGMDHPRDASRHLILRLCSADSAFASDLAGKI